MTTGNGNWREMFEQGRSNGGRSMGTPPPGPVREEPEPEADGLALDLSEYKPWILQRGRSRPALMLDLRRYEPKSGLWSGSALSYPSLIAVEYIGDKMLSLDFGMRQFIIEGHGLDELARHIQQGTVLAVHEYASSLWPTRPVNGVVSVIRNVAAGGGARQP